MQPPRNYTRTGSMTEDLVEYEVELEEKQDDNSSIPDRSRDTGPPVAVPAAATAPAPPVEDESQYLSGTKAIIVMSAVTCVVFLMLLDNSILATAIPKITSDFHSLQDVGWYGSAYMIASCCLQPLTGKMYMYFPNKWVFLGFLATFEVGSLICGAAQSSTMLILGRAVGGMGGSGMMNGSLTIISTGLPLRKRPAYLGVMMGFSQIATLCGPLVGGVLTQYASWRWCFYINLPAGGLAGLFVLLLRIPDVTVPLKNKSSFRVINEKFDLPGFVLFAPSAIQLLLALSWGGVNYAWGSATIIGLFCGSFGNLLIFLLWEHRAGNNAMIPLSMLRQRVLVCSFLVLFFFMGFMMTTTYYLPIYFQAVKNASPSLSGVYTLPSIISQLVTAVISGSLITKVGYYFPFGIIAAAVSMVAMGLFSTFDASTTTAEWIIYQIIGGFGRGVGMQVPIIAVQQNTAQAQLAICMTLVSFCNTLGGAIFLSLAETDFNSSLRSALAKYAPLVNADKVIAAGAGAVRSSVLPAQVSNVLHAYSTALSNTFYLALGASAATFIFSFGMGFKKMAKPPTPKKPEPAAEV